MHVLPGSGSHGLRSGTYTLRPKWAHRASGIWRIRQGAALSILIALLAACGGTDDVTPADASESSATHEGALTYAGPGGALGDLYRDILTDFGEEHGIQWTYEEGVTADNLAKVQAQAAAGQVEIDAILTSINTDPIGEQQGLFQDLDPEIVSNLDNIAPGLQREGLGGVTYSASPDGIVYRTDIFEEKGWDPPIGYADLWDPKYDCVVLRHPTGGSGDNSIAMMNYITSGGDYTAIESTIETFAPVKDRLVGIVLSDPEVIQRLEQGSACLAAAGQGRALQSKAQGAPIEFVIPEEGSLATIAGQQLTANAPHPVAAQLWINHLISKDVQSRLMIEGGNSPANSEVEKPATGVAASTVVASEFEEYDVRVVPPGTFEDLDRWAQQWDLAFAS